MLPTRHAVSRSTSASQYVCLGCRLRTQRRSRHNGKARARARARASEKDGFDTENTVGLHTLTQRDGGGGASPTRQVNTPDPPARPPQLWRKASRGWKLRWRVEDSEAAARVPPAATPTRTPTSDQRKQTLLRVHSGWRRQTNDGKHYNSGDGNDANSAYIYKHKSGSPRGRVHFHESSRHEPEPVFDDVVYIEPFVRKQWVTGRMQREREAEWEGLLETHARGGERVQAERETSTEQPSVLVDTAEMPSAGTATQHELAGLSNIVGAAAGQALTTQDGEPPLSAPSRDAETGRDLQKSREQTESSALSGARNHNTHPFMSSEPQQNGILGTAWQQFFSASTTSQARTYHTSRSHLQQQPAVAQSMSSDLPPPDFTGFRMKKVEKPNGIRAQLRQWQEQNSHLDRQQETVEIASDPDTGETSSNLSRLPDNNVVLLDTQANQQEDEQEAMAHFMQAPSDEPSSAEMNSRFLKMGDLVEIEFTRTDTPSIVAIFVRRVGNRGLNQLYTMQGRWIHMLEKRIQYSIPDWITEDAVKPLLQHLPDPESTETELEELEEAAKMKDLSVPREVAAPLVSRMVQFHAEAKEIYRRHAGTLDSAHALLAHDTDLRYGSLVSAATTLLRMPADKLPVTALFAVRQALSSAGFAFNIDRRSHRLTGYLQIRSKEQVRMVEHVRGWLREWQDDLAVTATMNEGQLRRHRPKRGAEYVHGFLKKAKKIVAKSREDRQPTEWGNVGPSKVRLPITPQQDSVRITMEETFTDQETELVRFIEAWSLSHMFLGLPRLEALPPLLLGATGFYEDMSLGTPTGLVFLQEIGTILPYENRVRFDQHLLLPSSQHSKPLQNLMTTLMEMADKHDFKDSMADLRHDWGRMPVYCIDDASAHEIDDGISIETIAVGTDGPKEWWVHIHIANPTAFFERDHPLAKMARHMGESIYMPERTYMMLPRWSTTRHFSLDRNRPCLTFSAKMNDDGEVLDRKIRSGTIRNVLRLTPTEVSELLGEKGTAADFEETVLTVGGAIPEASKKRKSRVGDVTADMLQQLKTLRMLAEKRAENRGKAGGLFFDSHKPDVQVWQTYKSSGLAWDHPFRKGWRRVEGDPIIQMRTRGLTNWFSPLNDPVQLLVRENMLLACEVAAKWCEERQVPAVFRGSVRRPDRMDSGKYFTDVLSPAAKRTATGEYPMHLGMQYLQTFGNTVLATKPFKHSILGMEHYGKVTSPLRRYGDMILHWQIEAALREEARTGQSLITDNEDAPRRFLPFSKKVLETIIVGLQPRESIIMKSKMYAENFWINQLLFRAHHFNEIALPFPNGLVRAYIHTPAGGFKGYGDVGCMMVELNVTAAMKMPKVGRGGEGDVVKMGDVWECEIEGVDCYRRTPVLRPVRLVERVEE